MPVSLRKEVTDFLRALLSGGSVSIWEFRHQTAFKQRIDYYLQFHSMWRSVCTLENKLTRKGKLRECNHYKSDPRLQYPRLQTCSSKRNLKIGRAGRTITTHDKQQTTDGRHTRRQRQTTTDDERQTDDDRRTTEDDRRPAKTERLPKMLCSHANSTHGAYWYS